MNAEMYKVVLDLAIKYKLFEFLLIYPVHTINHHQTWENPPGITYLEMDKTGFRIFAWHKQDMGLQQKPYIW